MLAWLMRWIVVGIVLVACGSRGSGTTLGALREACKPGHYWVANACRARGDGAAKVAEAKAALVEQNPQAAKLALDTAIAKGGPLDHETNVLLWEQAGIADAFLGNEAAAKQSFGMLLALDPNYFLSYTLKPEVTFVFEKVRNGVKKTGAPALEINWPSDQRVGDPVPVAVQVVADPKAFLHRATVFVRERGASDWRAADVTLDGKREARVMLPAVRAQKPTSLELYVRAYDAKDNEVLAWADPVQPREIPLRYDPPPKWYENWRTYVAGTSALLLVTGAVVYAVTVAPPDRVGGGAVLK
jgi:hypothetical protein